MYKYKPSDFPYPLNESIKEVYALYEKRDTDNLIPALNNLYFDLKDLYTFKKMPLEEVKEIQDYFRGLIND